MYEIAICDDDGAFAAKLRTMAEDVLREMGVPSQFSLYASPDALLEAIESGHRFDLVFLDILFDTERGIPFAKLLKERKWNIDIIFISSSPDYAIAGYDVYPLHYLLKPVESARLQAALERFLELRTPQRVRFNTSKGILQLQLSDILFFEIYDHEIVIHRRDGSGESCTGTLKELEAVLPPRSFVRPHRSYLVNLEYVSEIVRYRLRLSSGDVVPISKGLYPRVQRSLIDYADRDSTSV